MQLLFREYPSGRSIDHYWSSRRLDSRLACPRHRVYPDQALPPFIYPTGQLWPSCKAALLTRQREPYATVSPCGHAQWQFMLIARSSIALALLLSAFAHFGYFHCQRRSQVRCYASTCSDWKIVGVGPLARSGVSWIISTVRAHGAVALARFATPMAS